MGQALPVAVQVRPALGENKLFLLYQALGEDRFRFTPMTRTTGEEFRGDIPAEVVGAKAVEYYLRVIDGKANALARFPAGDAYLSVAVGAKLTEPPTPPAPQPKEKKKGGKKRLWVGVGAAAVGAGAYFTLGGKEEKGPTLQKRPGPPGHP